MWHMDDVLSSDNENQILTRCQQENQDKLVQPSPSQQRNIVCETYDSQLQTHVTFRSPIFDAVLLSTIESDNAIQNQIDFKYIDIQILRIITSSQEGANVYSRNRINSSQNIFIFSRLILAHVCYKFNVEDNQRLVYIVEAQNQKSNILCKNVKHCDNGSISTRSIIRFPFPLLLDNYMCCDITMIKSKMPSIILINPPIL